MEAEAVAEAGGGARSGARSPSPTPSAVSSASSALRDNIERKGKGSYYYAHDRVIDGPVWDGKEEPRLLHRACEEVDEAAAHVERIHKYAWSDEKKSVKVYVPVEGLAELPEDAVTFEWGEKSFTLDIRVENPRHLTRLRVSELCEEIESASMARKTDKIVISLKKKDPEATWSALKSKNLS